MFATRWEPVFGMNRLQDEMNRVFESWGARTPRYAQGVYPPLNLWEDGENYYVEAELPGFEMNDLEIYVTGGNHLSLKGQRKQPELENGTWHRQERGFGQFGRKVELPGDVNAEMVSADFCHGVLTVTLPKSEAAKPRKIAVKAA